MAEAVLRIRTEGAADVKRALGATQNAVKGANQAMSAAARAAAREQAAVAKAAAKSAKDAERAAKEAAKAREKADKDAARTKEQAERRAAAAAKQRAAEERREANRAAAEKKRNASEEARAAAKAEAEKTRAARKEANERKREAEKEARNKAELAKRSTKDVERAERDQSRFVERESKRRQSIRASERQRMRDDNNRRAVGAVSFAARTAMSAGTDLVGEARAARRQVAGGERAVGNAVFQAGGDRRESAARRQQVLDLAQRTGLSFDEVSSAMLSAQTEFSSLGERGMSRQQRDQRFADFSRTIEFAASTGNNAGETARLQGMLTQSGFSSDMQSTLMRFAAGAAQSGAIELGGLTREGLGSIMRRMAIAEGALGPGATSAQREAAMAGAFRQQVAAMEVFRGQGSTARNAGNALASMQTALRDPSRQDKIRNNIENATSATTDPTRRAALTALRSQLFENDPTRAGQQRLRSQFTDPMQFQAALARAVGNDPTAAANLLSGGGSQNAQSLLSNQRLLLSLMTAQDANGKSGADRILALQNATLSEADLSRGRDIFTNDTQAQINREETQRLKILTDNNSRLAQLAASLDRFRGEDPIAAAAARAAGGDVGEIVAAQASIDRPRLATEASYAGLGHDRFMAVQATASERARQGVGGMQGLREIFTEDGRRARETRFATEMAKGIGAAGGNVNQYLQRLPETLREAVQSAMTAALSSPQGGAFNRANAATGTNSTPPEHRSRG